MDSAAQDSDVDGSHGRQGSDGEYIDTEEEEMLDLKDDIEGSAVSRSTKPSRGRKVAARS